MANQAWRVLAIVTKKSPLYMTALIHTKEFISRALLELQGSILLRSNESDDALPKLLVKHVWLHSIHVVFDIFNPSYDSTIAHLEENNNLPVISMHYGRVKIQSTYAGAALRKTVNNETANMHNLHGRNGAPPYVVDFTSGSTPIYLDPRDPKKLLET